MAVEGVDKEWQSSHFEWTGSTSAEWRLRARGYCPVHRIKLHGGGSSPPSLHSVWLRSRRIVDNDGLIDNHSGRVRGSDGPSSSGKCNRLGVSVQGPTHAPVCNLRKGDATKLKVTEILLFL